MTAPIDRSKVLATSGMRKASASTAVTTPSLNTSRHVVAVRNWSLARLNTTTNPSHRYRALARLGLSSRAQRAMLDGLAATSCSSRWRTSSGVRLSCAWSSSSTVRSWPRCRVRTMRPSLHDEHAVAQPDELVGVGRRDEHGHAVGRRRLDDARAPRCGRRRRRPASARRAAAPSGCRRRLRPSITFCWLPPDRVAIGASVPEATTPSRSIQRARLGALGAAVDAAEPAQVAQPGDREVLAERHRREQPEPRPRSLGTKAMPARSAASGSCEGTAVVPTATSPASRGRWPDSSGMTDSRPEPSSPATPTTSPRPTSSAEVGDVAAGEAARRVRQRFGVASPVPSAAPPSETARPTISSTSSSWSSASRPRWPPAGRRAGR